MRWGGHLRLRGSSCILIVRLKFKEFPRFIQGPKTELWWLPKRVLVILEDTFLAKASSVVTFQVMFWSLDITNGQNAILSTLLKMWFRLRMSFTAGRSGRSLTPVSSSYSCTNKPPVLKHMSLYFSLPLLCKQGQGKQSPLHQQPIII